MQIVPVSTRRHLWKALLVSAQCNAMLEDVPASNVFCNILGQHQGHQHPSTINTNQNMLFSRSLELSLSLTITGKTCSGVCFAREFALFRQKKKNVKLFFRNTSCYFTQFPHHWKEGSMFSFQTTLNCNSSYIFCALTKSVHTSSTTLHLLKNQFTFMYQLQPSNGFWRASAALNIFSHTFSFPTARKQDTEAQGNFSPRFILVI